MRYCVRLGDVLLVGIKEVSYQLVELGRVGDLAIVYYAHLDVVLLGYGFTSPGMISLYMTVMSTSPDRYPGGVDAHRLASVIIWNDLHLLVRKMRQLPLPPGSSVEVSPKYSYALKHS